MILIQFVTKYDILFAVPPEAPRIYDYEGTEILGSVAGPFREGQNVLLSCQAAGGELNQVFV